MKKPGGMIERVARELCERFSNLDLDAMIPVRDGPQITIKPDVPKTGLVEAWTKFTSHAREIIEAMRYPSDAVAVAVNAENANWDGYTTLRRYQMVIDAVLAEGS